MIHLVLLLVITLHIRNVYTQSQNSYCNANTVAYQRSVALISTPSDVPLNNNPDIIRMNMYTNMSYALYTSINNGYTINSPNELYNELLYISNIGCSNNDIQYFTFKQAKYDTNNNNLIITVDIPTQSQSCSNVATLIDGNDILTAVGNNIMNNDITYNKQPNVLDSIYCVSWQCCDGSDVYSNNPQGHQACNVYKNGAENLSLIVITTVLSVVLGLTLMLFIYCIIDRKRKQRQLLARDKKLKEQLSRGYKPPPPDLVGVIFASKQQDNNNNDNISYDSVQPVRHIRNNNKQINPLPHQQPPSQYNANVQQYNPQNLQQQRIILPANINNHNVFLPHHQTMIIMFLLYNSNYSHIKLY